MYIRGDCKGEQEDKEGEKVKILGTVAIVRSDRYMLFGEYLAASLSLCVCLCQCEHIYYI